MADENSKKYLDKAGLSAYTQQLKNKLDETYSTIEYVDDAIGKVHEYDTILTIPKDKLNELIDGTGNTKDTTYDVDTLNIIETMYTVELEDKIYEKEAYYDEIAGHIALYAYIYFDNEITAYAAGSSSKKNIRIILQEHKDVNYKDDETKTCVFVEVTGITEEFTSDAVIKLKRIKSDLLYDYATKEYVDENIFSGDYNDLTNVPIKDDRVFEEFYYTFDGDVTSYETVTPDDFEGMEYAQSYAGGDLVLVRISDSCPPVNNIYGDIELGILKGEDSSTFSVSKKNIAEIWVGIFAIYDFLLFIPNDIGNIKQGIYVLYIDEEYYVNSVRFMASYTGEFIQLDNKYLQDHITIGTRSEEDVEPLSENGVSTFEIIKDAGDYSLTVGLENKAESSSIASGYMSKATGECSFASGYMSKATGEYSYAGGFKTESSGESTHAEGDSTTASGYASHAEGFCAEARGGVSHAEGISTIASGIYQHVQGRYNIEDTENKYAHIVGNGKNDSSTGWKDVRSNAHTLDWNGNAWYQGNVSVDGTPTNDNDLTTKKYVDNAVANADPLVEVFPLYSESNTIFGKVYNINLKDLTHDVIYIFPEDVRANYSMVQLLYIADDGTEAPVGLTNFDAVEEMRFINTGTEFWVTLSNTEYEANIADASTADKITVTTHKNSAYLGINNNTEYIPTDDYNPATKKYVDDAIVELMDSNSVNDYEIAKVNAKVSSIYNTKMQVLDGKFTDNVTYYTDADYSVTPQIGAKYAINIQKIIDDIGVNDVFTTVFKYKANGEDYTDSYTFETGISTGTIVSVELTMAGGTVDALFRINAYKEYNSDISLVDSEHCSVYITFSKYVSVELIDEIVNSMDLSVFLGSLNVLTLNNKEAYTPATDYQPATKKYVDEKTAGCPQISNTMIIDSANSKQCIDFTSGTQTMRHNLYDYDNFDSHDFSTLVNPTIEVTLENGDVLSVPLTLSAKYGILSGMSGGYGITVCWDHVDENGNTVTDYDTLRIIVTKFDITTYQIVYHKTTSVKFNATVVHQLMNGALIDKIDYSQITNSPLRILTGKINFLDYVQQDSGTEVYILAGEDTSYSNGYFDPDYYKNYIYYKDGFSKTSIMTCYDMNFERDESYIRLANYVYIYEYVSAGYTDGLGDFRYFRYKDMCSYEDFVSRGYIQARNEYYPTEDFNLTTKKYVDDVIDSIDTNDLVVTNSISMGRKEDTAIGEKSVAVGYDVEASGAYSHAEGFETIASGEFSHAEGDSTTASGYASHAEGCKTKASEINSHAEGYHTIASSVSQHVQGEYNIEDAENTYVHIVGNGIADDNRSNAHTLDWDGNGWFAGNVTIGADNKKLATEEYVDSKVAYHDVPISQGFNLNPGYIDLMGLETYKKYKLSKDFEMSGTLKIPLVLVNDDGTKFAVNNPGNTLGFTKLWDATIIVIAKASSQIMFYYDDINSGTLNISAKKTDGVWAVQKVTPMKLTASNEYPFTPTSDYHPATKKYVDNKTSACVTEEDICDFIVNNGNKVYLDAVHFLDLDVTIVDNVITNDYIEDKIVESNSKYCRAIYNTKDIVFPTALKNNKTKGVVTIKYADSNEFFAEAILSYTSSDNKTWTMASVSPHRFYIYIYHDKRLSVNGSTIDTTDELGNVAIEFRYYPTSGINNLNLNVSIDYIEPNENYITQLDLVKGGLKNSIQPYDLPQGKTTGRNSINLGNQTVGYYMYVNGDNNIPDSNGTNNYYSSIIGTNNNYGNINYSSIMGYGNNIPINKSGSCNACISILGEYNTVDNTNHTDYVSVIGNYLKVSADHTFALGKYGTVDKNTMFALCNGTSTDNEKIIFSVNRDGKVTAGADPVDEMDLVTKKYVDDNKFSGDYNDLDNKPFLNLPKHSDSTEAFYIVDVKELVVGCKYIITEIQTTNIKFRYYYDESNYKAIAIVAGAAKNIIEVYASAVTETKVQFYVDNILYTVDNIDSSAKTSTVTKTAISLKTDNTIAYTPTNNYHPATKKYVDDLVNNSKEDLTEEDIDTMLSDVFGTIE